MHSLFVSLEPLLTALEPFEVRAVGGAVRAVLRRDPLLNVEVDFATNALPNQVLECCLNAGLPTATPGLRWGTVTVQVAERQYEITTLRQDTYLKGSRYPTVHFTQSWDEDAARRDFTINAAYLSPEGELFDPYNGAEDLKNGIVRFIGEPMVRLTEDPLRMLRFWRFCAHYGMGGVTSEVVEAFVQAAPGLATLSRSRVQREWEKLLQAPQAATVVAELQRLGLLESIRERL